MRSEERSPPTPHHRQVAIAIAAMAWTFAFAPLAGCVGEGEQIIKPQPPGEGEGGGILQLEVHHGAPQDFGTWDRLTVAVPQPPTTLGAAQGRVLVGTEAGLFAAHADVPDQTEPFPLRAAAGEPEATGRIHTLSRRASGGVLAAAELGLFHDHEGTLYVSPLTSSLPGPVSKLDVHGTSPDEELWLLPASGEAGRLWVVTPSGLHDLKLSVDTAPDAVVALGGGRGLVSAGGVLYDVNVVQRSARVAAEGLGSVHAVDRNADGFLFLGTDTGLVTRDAEGRWSRYTLTAATSTASGTGSGTGPGAPQPVRSVFAGVGGQVWLSTDTDVMQLGGAGLVKLATRSGPGPAVARDASGDTWMIDQGQVTRLLTGAPVTFSQHVQPFLATHCSSCHREGNGAPVIDFENYDVAKEKSDRIVVRLEADGASPMPPQSVEILTREQYAVVLRWVAGGMKP